MIKATTILLTEYCYQINMANHIVGFLMTSRNWFAFLGNWGFTPIPVFIGKRQILLPLIYWSQKPFKSVYIPPLRDTQIRMDLFIGPFESIVRIHIMDPAFVGSITTIIL